jgi:hypothetical protein
MEGGAVGHNFERDPPRDHPCQVWFNLVQRFQSTRFKCDLLSFTPKIVGAFYMQGYKVKEKTAIVPQFQNSVGTLKLSFDFLQISKNYKKIMLKFLVLYILFLLDQVPFCPS